jgi:hypothetical protein
MIDVVAEAVGAGDHDKLPGAGAMNLSLGIGVVPGTRYPRRGPGPPSVSTGQHAGPTSLGDG